MSTLDVHGTSAAPTTVEALMYELREQGMAALQKAECRRRLGELSSAQIREVLARLIKGQPTCPKISDNLLLKLGALL